MLAPMEQRPRSTFGLLIHAAKLKWAGLDRMRKLVLVGVLLATGLAVATWAQCALGSGSCATSSGCPMTAGASPCAR